MMSTTPTTNIRPYTSYNLFFQLEREHILQTLLGYQPTIADKDKFDFTTDHNYHGPPLPSKYTNIILPYDWYMPGKNQRRNKRSHRKSHGKIGFRELTERISKAWKSDMDDGTRTFCIRLSDSEARRYKIINKRNKQIETVATARKQKVTRKRSKDDEVMMAKLIKKEPEGNVIGCKHDLVVPLCLAPDDFPQDSSPPKIGRTVSHESFHDVLQKENLSRDATTNASRSPRDSSSWTEVDMTDDEIIFIWESTPVEDEDVSIHFILCRECSVSPLSG